MADQDLLDLTETTAPALADWMYLVQGTTDHKVTVQNLLGLVTLGSLLDVVFVRKTADQTLTTAVLANDTHLVLPIGVNEIWVVDFALIIDGPTAGDFSCALNVPALAGGWFTGQRVVTGIASTSGDLQSSATTSLVDGGLLTMGTGGAGTVMHGQFKAMVVNGSNAGNVQLRVAQNNASGTTTVRTNSYLEARRYL